MPNYVIIDGNLILHKSFHIYENLSVSLGGQKVKTGITYGVLHTIARMEKLYKPCRVAIVFDSLLPSMANREDSFVSVPTHREGIYPRYKEGRHEPSSEMIEGFKQLCSFLSYMEISTVFSSSTWEADDAIAFLVNDCKEKCSRGKSKIIVISDDKDFFQLIRNEKHYSVVVHSRGDNVVDFKSFYKRFGFVPKNHTDYLALVGDSTDNVPGVKGIGPKAASDMLKSTMYIKPEVLAARLNPKDIKSYLMNRSLVSLHKKPDSIGAVAACNLDMKVLNNLFRNYRMVSFLRKEEQQTLKRMKRIELAHIKSFSA